MNLEKIFQFVEFDINGNKFILIKNDVHINALADWSFLIL